MDILTVTIESKKEELNNTVVLPDKRQKIEAAFTEKYKSKHLSRYNEDSNHVNSNTEKTVAIEIEPMHEYFNSKQKWEGYVVEVGESTFSAMLVPIVGEGPAQEAEIYIEDISEEDHELIEPGAVFYWSIGYLDRPSGRLRTSQIRFRRLPVWSSLELEKAGGQASKILNLIEGNAKKTSS